ncbi:MAG: fumarylacetoacetase [Burkholderiaceae bacterium]|nr:fumarylacetoacetase [Burkholderiaceae bacterium]
MTLLNHTHNPAARSWLASANVPGADFPIQNLPIAVFRHFREDEPFRGGIAIGDQVIDLARVVVVGCLEGLAAEAAMAGAYHNLNVLMALGPQAWKALRHGLFDLLQEGAEGPRVDALRSCLIPQLAVEYNVPALIGDYTDFYTSVHHAANIGKILRGDNGTDPVLPNFRWIPVGYHGRASTIGVSGQEFLRPVGQSLPAGDSAPVFGPSKRLDYELELGIYMGPGNAMGVPIALADVDKHIFGMCLLNDWSARDVQGWEYQPLGPFLSKNFATTVSPWIVSMEALAPYRQAWTRAATDPQPLPYLNDAHNNAQGALDIQLEVSILTAQRQAAGADAVPVSQTSFSHQYWSVGQMVAHHTVGGCNLQPGDLLGTGTISGPTLPEAGALIELTQGGRNPITLSGPGAADEQRGFLEDGDTVIIRGWCEKPGAARIGFGECRGTVLPARELA